MNLKAILEAIHEDADTSTPIEIQKAAKLIIRAQEMKGGEIDVIFAAFNNGPLYDEDVPSKSGRDSLLADGFIAKVVVKGQDGFNALTYTGREIHHILVAMDKPVRDQPRTEAVERLALAQLEKRIEDLADVLASAHCIALRNGRDTHWRRFALRLSELGIGFVTAKTFKVLPSDTVGDGVHFVAGDGVHGPTE